MADRTLTIKISIDQAQALSAMASLRKEFQSLAKDLGDAGVKAGAAGLSETADAATKAGAAMQGAGVAASAMGAAFVPAAAYLGSFVNGLFVAGMQVPLLAAGISSVNTPMLMLTSGLQGTAGPMLQLQAGVQRISGLLPEWASGYNRVRDAQARLSSAYQEWTRAGNVTTQTAINLGDGLQRTSGFADLAHAAFTKVTSLLGGLRQGLTNAGSPLDSLRQGFTNATTASYYFGKDVVKQTAGIKQWHQEADQMRRNAYALTIAGYQLSSMAGAVNDAFASALKTFVDFDFNLRRAAGAMEIMDSSSPDFRDLANQIQDLSESTKLLSPAQLAKDMYFWASTTGEVASGHAAIANVINNELLPVMKAAAMTEIGEEAAIKGVVGVMQEYGLGMENTADVTEKMFYAAQKTSMEFGDLIQSMRFVGPIAAQMGMTFEETVQVLGSLSSAGIRGTKAGTALRQEFRQLVTPTAQATEVLDDMVNQTLHLSDTWEHFIFPNGQFAGLEVIISALAKGINTMTDAEAANLLKKTSTAAMMPGYIQMIRDQADAMKQGQSIFKDTLNLSDASTNFAANWKIMSESARGTLVEMSNQITGFTNMVGEALMQIIAPIAAVIGRIAEFGRQLAQASPALFTLVVGIGAGIATVAAFAASLLVLAGGMTLLGVAAKNLQAMMMTTRMSMEAGDKATGVLATSLGRLAAIKDLGFITIASRLVVIAAIFAVLSGFLDGFMKAISKNTNLMKGFQGVLDLVGDAFQAIVDIGTAVFDIIGQIGNAFGTLAGSIVSVGLDFLADNIDDVKTAIEALILVLTTRWVAGWAIAAAAAVGSSVTQVGAIGLISLAFDAMGLSAAAAWALAAAPVVIGAAAIAGGLLVTKVAYDEVTKAVDSSNKSQDWFARVQAVSQEEARRTAGYLDTMTVSAWSVRDAVGAAEKKINDLAEAERRLLEKKAFMADAGSRNVAEKQGPVIDPEIDKANAEWLSQWMADQKALADAAAAADAAWTKQWLENRQAFKAAQAAAQADFEQWPAIFASFADGTTLASDAQSRLTASFAGLQTLYGSSVVFFRSAVSEMVTSASGSVENMRLLRDTVEQFMSNLPESAAGLKSYLKSVLDSIDSDLQSASDSAQAKTTALANSTLDVYLNAVKNNKGKMKEAALVSLDEFITSYADNLKTKLDPLGKATVDGLVGALNKMAGSESAATRRFGANMAAEIAKGFQGGGAGVVSAAAHILNSIDKEWSKGTSVAKSNAREWTSILAQSIAAAHPEVADEMNHILALMRDGSDAAYAEGYRLLRNWIVAQVKQMPAITALMDAINAYKKLLGAAQQLSRLDPQAGNLGAVASIDAKVAAAKKEYNDAVAKATTGQMTDLGITPPGAGIGAGVGSGASSGGGGSGAKQQSPLEKALETAQNAAGLAEALNKIAGMDIKAMVKKSMGKIAEAMLLATQITYDITKGFGKKKLQEVADFSDAVSKIVGFIGTAAESFAKLDMFKVVPKAVFTNLATDVKYAVQTIQDVSGKFKIEGVAKAVVFSEAATKIVALIGAAFDAFSKISGYHDVTKKVFNAIALDIAEGTQSLSKAATLVSPDAVSRASTFSEGATKVVELINTAYDAFTKVDGYSGIAKTSFNDLADDVGEAIASIAHAAVLVGSARTGIAATFSNDASKVVALVSQAIEAFIKFGESGMPQISATAFASLESNVAESVRAIQRAATIVGQDAADAAGKFSESAGKVVTVIGTAFEAFSKISSFNPPTTEDIGKIVDSMILAVQTLIDRTKVLKIKEKELSAAGGFADTAGKIMSAITATVSAFAGTVGKVLKEDEVLIPVDIEVVFKQIETTVARMKKIAAEFSAVDLASISSTADAASKVASAISAFFSIASGSTTTKNEDTNADPTTKIQDMVATIMSTMKTFAVGFAGVGASIVTNTSNGMNSKEQELLDTIDALLKSVLGKFSGFHLDYQAAGNAIGMAIASGLLETKAAVDAAAREIAAVIARYLALKSPAEAGPLSVPAENWGAKFVNDWLDGAVSAAKASTPKISQVADIFSRSFSDVNAAATASTSMFFQIDSAPRLIEIHHTLDLTNAPPGITADDVADILNAKSISSISSLGQAAATQ